MKVLIITLDREEERVAHARHLVREFRSQGLQPEIFRATDCRSAMFRDIEYVASADQPIRMVPGELGCAWSHVRACRAIVESKQPAFVVEDDAYFHAPLSTVAIGPVTEFLSLSCYDPDEQHNSRWRIVGEEEGGHQVTKGLPYGTQCYFITPAGAAKFLRHAVPVCHPADLALHHLSVQGHLKTLLAKIPIAAQGEGFESYIGLR